MDNTFEIELDSGEKATVGEDLAKVKREKVLFSGMEVGTPLSIEIPGLQGRYKSRLLGFEPGQFLIIKLPSIPGVREWFQPASDIVIRFVSNGSVIGFISSVIQLHFEPIAVGFIAFPQHAERIDLRKDKRVACFFSAVLEVNSVNLEGAILDISAGGCRFFLDQSPDALKRVGAIEQGDKVSLQVEGIAPSPISGEIAGIDRKSELHNFGIKFLEISPEVREKIEGMENISSKLQGKN